MGYFAISDARLLFQYAFTILNSLQGFFIFVLFVARKKQVREQWKMICCCIYPDQQKAQRTLSASTSYPSTCSSRSNSSTSTLHHQGRTDRSDSCKTTTSFIGTDYDSIYTVPYSRASRESLYYRKLWYCLLSSLSHHCSSKLWLCLDNLFFENGILNFSIFCIATSHFLWEEDVLLIKCLIFRQGKKKLWFVEKISFAKM